MNGNRDSGGNLAPTPHATEGGTGPRVEKKVDSVRGSSRDCAGQVPCLPCPSRTPRQTAIWAVQDARTSRERQGDSPFPS